MVPDFSKEILALDRKDVQVQGFIIPLDVGDQQKRFLLTLRNVISFFTIYANIDNFDPSKDKLIPLAQRSRQHRCQA